MTAATGYGDLSVVERLIIVFAEEDSAGSHAGLAATTTECLAYHVAPADEDRRSMWAGASQRLEAAGFTIGDDPGGAAELVVTERWGEGVEAVLAAVASPEHALVAVALGGGDALPVVAEAERLGAPGVLRLSSPWTRPGWVSEEVLDHTSLLQLVEHWSAARGRPVVMPVPEWRRRLTGDLLRVVELRDPEELPVPPAVPGRRLARPAPYFPIAELIIGDAGPSLRLTNVGPVARLAAPLLVDDGVERIELVVPPSALDDQLRVTIPVAVRDGGYDVTVLGPDHFRRRFAGRFPDAGLHCTADFFLSGDPWFPELVLTVWHDRTLPVAFRLERRLGERAASKSGAYGTGTFERIPGPRRTARFKEEPGANSFGWYDVAVTAEADASWVREYAGRVPTGVLPGLAY